MVNKIEEVAQALCCEDGCKQPGACWIDRPHQTYRVPRVAAKTTIEAMRTMTPEMERVIALASCELHVIPAEKRCRFSGSCVAGRPSAIHTECAARARRSHEAAIDAALKGDA